MDQTVYEEEQQHLSLTYAQLLEMKKELEEAVVKLDADASEEKNDIRDNLRFDTADDEVKTEMYAEIETWNRYIDSYNVRQSVLQEKLKKVNLLLETPYFARVTLQFDPDEEPENYYIGRAAVSENAGLDQVVIDWRSPIAETYYNQDNGKTWYEVNGRRIDVDLKLRRQFDLLRDHLNGYFDTSVAIEDPMLLKSLSKRRTDKMQAITVTIQREQNAVIRYPDVPVLLVNGIAGSGKTSVLLQRIAYLFYHKRKTLRPENVYLMTLNPVFAQYIAGVLPDLGEQNANTLTWTEFLNEAHVPSGGAGLDTTADSLRRIEELLPSYKLTAADIRPVTQKGRKVLGRGRILEILAHFSERIPTGERLVNVVSEELLEEARRVLRRKEESAERRAGDESDGNNNAWEDADEEGVLEAERIAHRAEDTDNGPLRRASVADRLNSEHLSGTPGGKHTYSANGSDDDIANMSLREENAMVNDYGGAFKQIRDGGFLDVEHIGCSLLGKTHLTSMEWLYLKMTLTGLCDRNAQYVCVDEVQDYTEAQLKTLSKYFPNAKFMMLGDEFQSIRDGNITFTRIHGLFEEQGRKTVELPLATSYRSSPEITGLFAGLLPEKQSLEAKSVQRPGVEPVIEAFASEEEYLTKLKGYIAEESAAEGLTAVICENRRSLKKIAELLGADAPAVLHGNEHLPQSGAFLIELQYAKGLEFDSVILPDVDDRTCPDTQLVRHKLYTAISRATQRLHILARGNLSPLLR